MANVRRIPILVFALMLAIALVGWKQGPVRAAAGFATSPLLVTLGDSIEVGLGDEIAINGTGYVASFGNFLSLALGQPVDVHNLGQTGATTLDIMLRQLPTAVAEISAHAGSPIVVSWGGGGNDLGLVALSPQAAVCQRQPSCLARFNAVLNQAEQAIDRTIAALRLAGGPNARIFMRTQYNALLRTGCGTPQSVALGNITLEGAPGTILDRGLNDRIRDIAARYDATVVDLFPTFAVLADQLVSPSPDCTHPNDAGYQAILGLFIAAY
jgi:lysophospholipase L1-like esterase